MDKESLRENDFLIKELKKEFERRHGEEFTPQVRRRIKKRILKKIRQEKPKNSANNS